MPIAIHENGPTSAEVGRRRWIRLVVNEQATPEDEEAAKLLIEFAQALEQSDYGHEFVLSIYRIEPKKAPAFGLLPKVESQPGCEGVVAVRRFFTRYIEDIKVPLAI